MRAPRRAQPSTLSETRPRGRTPTYAKTVPCPDCGSPAGVVCLSISGKVVQNWHRSRIRMAARARAAAKEAEEKG
jgi:hypothetical protein